MAIKAGTVIFWIKCCVVILFCSLCKICVSQEKNALNAEAEAPDIIEFSGPPREENSAHEEKSQTTEFVGPPCPMCLKQKINHELINEIIQKFEDPVYSPDKTCQLYVRRHRSDPIPKGLLASLANNYVDLLCNQDEHAPLYENYKNRKGRYVDVLKRVFLELNNKPTIDMFSKSGLDNFKTSGALKWKDLKEINKKKFFEDLKSNFDSVKDKLSKNLKNDPANLAILFSMLTALTNDETSAFPLTKLHTDSSLTADWESGLYHVAPVSLYADIYSPTDINSSNNPHSSDNINLRMDLTKIYQKYLQRIKESTKLKDIEGASKLKEICGLNNFNEKYFSNFSSRLSKNLEGSDFKFQRDFSPQAIYNKFKKIFEKDKEFEITPIDKKNSNSDPLNLNNFLTAAIQSAPKSQINKYFFKSYTEFSNHFVNTFRELQYYCPKFATEFTAYSLRLNSLQQGGIKANELYPHCFKFYVELNDNKKRICGEEP